VHCYHVFFIFFLWECSFWRFICYFSSLFCALLFLFGDFIFCLCSHNFFLQYSFHSHFIFNGQYIFILTTFHLPQNMTKNSVKWRRNHKQTYFGPKLWVQFLVCYENQIKSFTSIYTYEKGIQLYPLFSLSKKM
jgi:hypothetical protein